MPRGACLAPLPHATLGLSSWIIFHFLLKKLSHLLTKAISTPVTLQQGANAQPPTGRQQCPAPGRSQGLGRRTGAAHVAVSHQRVKASPCLASSHCAAHEPLGRFRAVGLTPSRLTLVPSHTPIANTCRHGETRLCEGTSVLHKGQREIRLTGLSSIHSRCISCRYLLFRISSATSNVCPSHELPHWPKVFGGFQNCLSYSLGGLG